MKLNPFVRTPDIMDSVFVFAVGFLAGYACYLVALDTRIILSTCIGLAFVLIFHKATIGRVTRQATEWAIRGAVAIIIHSIAGAFEDPGNAAALTKVCQVSGWCFGNNLVTK